MRTILLIAVSAVGLSQTACQIKVASDNQLTANVSAPINVNPGALPTSVPVTVLSLPGVGTSTAPAGTTPIAGTTPTTPTTGTTPMVPIVTSSAKLTETQKSNFVRASIQSTFSRVPASTFQYAKNPTPAQPVAKVKSVATATGPVVAVNREPKVEVTRAVETSR